MNEQIRALAAKAGIFYYRKGQLQSDMEKFVEVIVDEVYDYILNATFDDEPWPDRKDVKKHFGVEE